MVGHQVLVLGIGVRVPVGQHMKKLYKDITDLFQQEMIHQLAANERKGDRAGWLACDPMQLVIEVYYHTGKLQEAVKNNNADLIKEYSADVANLAMMVLDKTVGILPLEEKEISDKPNTVWTKNIISTTENNGKEKSYEK